MSLLTITPQRYILSLLRLMFCSASFSVCAKHCRWDGIVLVVWVVVAMTRKRTRNEKTQVTSKLVLFSLFFTILLLLQRLLSVCLSFHYFFPFFRSCNSRKLRDVCVYVYVCIHAHRNRRFSTKLSWSMTKEHTYCVPITHAYSTEDLCSWPLEHTNR
jgi:hypothetical protein